MEVDVIVVVDEGLLLLLVLLGVAVARVAARARVERVEMRILL